MASGKVNKIIVIVKQIVKELGLCYWGVIL